MKHSFDGEIGEAPALMGPSLLEFQTQLLSYVEGSTYAPGRRTQIALASLFVAHDHYRAIAVLLEKGLFASALALNRPLYEALVKGLWLSHCAPESKLENYAAGRELESLNELTEDLLSTEIPAAVRNGVRRVKQRYWKLFSSFAHAGHAQVRRWLSPTGVESSYAPAEIQESINFAAFMVLAATLEMARLSGNQEALSTLDSLLPSADKRRE